MKKPSILKVRKILYVIVMSGTANHRTIVFIAENVRQTSNHTQEEEGITQMRNVSFRQVFKMIRTVD
jgi:hypothetical protein